MQHLRKRVSVGVMALALGVAPLAASAGDPAVFDLSIRGFRAGTLSFSGREAAASYEVMGKLESAGLVAMIRKVRYDGTVTGTVRAGRFTPSRYGETADTGKRRSEAVMEYRRGVPQVKTYNPPKVVGDGGIDPATQGGTVDPLTAMFVALRDVPAGQECNQRLALFDGKRSSRVVLGAPQAVSGGVTCAGEYRRIGGFSAADMAEKTRFAFTLMLVPGEAGMMQVREVTMDSLYGKAVLKRR